MTLSKNTKEKNPFGYIDKIPDAHALVENLPIGEALVVTLEMKGKVRRTVFSTTVLSQHDLNEQLNMAGETLIRSNIDAFNTLRAGFPQWKPDFSGKRFEQVNLSGVNLSGANLQGASFIGSKLQNANLKDSNCSNALMSSINLKGADLRNVDFSSADLSCSFLCNSDIRGANMRTAEVDTGYLREVADEKGGKVKVLTVLGIKFDEQTTFPEKINLEGEQASIYLAGKRVSASVSAILEQLER